MIGFVVERLVVRSLYAALGQELSNGWYEVVGYLHDSLFLVFVGSLVFGNRLFFALLLVVSEDVLNPFLIPTWWKPGLFHRFPLFRRLRRYASKGLPVRS